MSLPHRQWCFLSYIRIFDSGSEANNTLRLERASLGAVTVTIPAGVYCLGINGNGDANSLPAGCWGGDEEDYDIFGTESLLEVLTEAINIKVDFATQKLNLSLDTGASLNGSGLPTGKVICTIATPFDDITFYWSNVLTTIDPAWLGVATTNGVYADSVVEGGGGEALGSMSSTLALVGAKVLGAQPQYESYWEAGVLAGDGSTAWKTFGDGYDEISEFIVNVEGIPTAGHNSGFHALRRWSRQLRLSRAKRRFIFIPDLGYSSSPPVAWDPDDETVSYQWGFRQLCLDPLRGYRFENIRRFSSRDHHWQLPVPVRRFSA